MVWWRGRAQNGSGGQREEDVTSLTPGREVGAELQMESRSCRKCKTGRGKTAVV